MKRTKHAATELTDMPYIDNLTGDAAVWMNIYLRATLSYDSDALAVLLTPEHAHKQESLQRQIWNESDARRRDLMNVGQRAPLPEAQDSDRDEHETVEAQLEPGQCGHCYRRKCRCKGKRQRFPRYSPLDYQNR